MQFLLTWPKYSLKDVMIKTFGRCLVTLFILGLIYDKRLQFLCDKIISFQVTQFEDTISLYL